MIIKWSELTVEQRDLLVAETVFNYQPLMCSGDHWDEQYVTIHNDGYAVCRECDGRGYISYRDNHPEAFSHKIVPPKNYSTDMNAAIDAANQPCIKSWSIERRDTGSYFVKVRRDDRNFALPSVSVLASDCPNLAEALCIALLFALGEYFISDPFHVKSY